MRPFLFRSMFLAVLLAASSCRDRQACNSDDIELIDSCLLNENMETAIARLNADSTMLVPMVTSARNVAGIYVRKPGSFYIELITDQEYKMPDEELNNDPKNAYRKILKSRIVGVCWQKPGAGKAGKAGDTRYLGCGRWFGF